MDIKAALDLIEANLEDKDVKGFFDKNVKTPSTDELFSTLEKTDEGKAKLHSFADKRVTSGVTSALEKFKAEKLPAILEEKLAEQAAELTAKLKPEKTEAEKAMDELNKKVQRLEKENKLAESKSAVFDLFAKSKVDTSLADVFISEDRDTAIANASKFIEDYNKSIDSLVEVKVKETFKKHGYNPDKVKENEPTVVTQKQIDNAAEEARRLGTDESRANYARLKRQFAAQNNK